MTRVEKLVLAWFAAFFIYLTFAANTPFWQSYFYFIWQITASVLLWELRDRINKFLMYSAFIFNLEYIGYNILLACQKNINKKLFVTVFLISIITLLLTTFIYNTWHSRR